MSSKTETASPAEISTHKKHCGTRGDMELSSDSPVSGKGYCCSSVQVTC